MSNRANITQKGRIAISWVSCDKCKIAQELKENTQNVLNLRVSILIWKFYIFWRMCPRAFTTWVFLQGQMSSLLSKSLKKLYIWDRIIYVFCICVYV